MNKPELLPKGEVTPVIDVAGFLTDGEVGALLRRHPACLLHMPAAGLASSAHAACLLEMPAVGPARSSSRVAPAWRRHPVGWPASA